MRTKIFHPEHEKFKPIFKQKPNPNQKKNFKIQTKTQPQTETKFPKTKPKLSQEFSKLNPNPRANPIEKKIKQDETESKEKQILLLLSMFCVIINSTNKNLTDSQENIDLVE